MSVSLVRCMGLFFFSLSAVQERLADLGRHQDVPQACLNKISHQTETQGSFIVHQPFQFKSIGNCQYLSNTGNQLHLRIDCQIYLPVWCFGAVNFLQSMRSIAAVAHCRLPLVPQDRDIPSLWALCPPASQIAARKPTSKVDTIARLMWPSVTGTILSVYD